MPTVTLDAPIPAATVEAVARRGDADERALARAVDELHASLVDGSDAIVDHAETRDAPAPVVVADGLATVVLVDDATWTQTLRTHGVPDDLGPTVRAVHAAFAADAAASAPDASRREPLVLPSRTVSELVRVGLSTRQAEVQVLHDTGLDYATIADRLRIAESTVKVHRHRIQEKVEQANRLLDAVED
ncbi:LuxR C-terminal-related transcriptional regulator [Halorubellus sp. PRR65]|uniref:helix-turn-helix transcriptional regulator n=1 Tax=Halorubellus sp. PRR65 TaxID=3098148 RepID=UPI002B2632AE|nr:LuxR C-terminal-related transcriptional regulator [Halorubellus sp. PRR65]